MCRYFNFYANKIAPNDCWRDVRSAVKGREGNGSAGSGGSVLLICKTIKLKRHNTLSQSAPTKRHGWYDTGAFGGRCPWTLTSSHSTNTVTVQPLLSHSRSSMSRLSAVIKGSSREATAKEANVGYCHTLHWYFPYFPGESHLTIHRAPSLEIALMNVNCTPGQSQAFHPRTQPVPRLGKWTHSMLALPRMAVFLRRCRHWWRCNLYPPPLRGKDQVVRDWQLLGRMEECTCCVTLSLHNYIEEGRDFTATKRLQNLTACQERTAVHLQDISKR